MASKSKLLKNTGIGLLIILVAIQFIHPAKNLANDTANDITKKYYVPDSVLAILKTSCYDCHSNHTEYPWYNNTQPVAWWLGHHIDEGRHDLNFNEFSAYRIGRRYHKLEQISHMVTKGEMPISSYTLIHRYAVLSEAQRKLVAGWADALHDSIRAAYPADSLKMPKRKRD
jgi:hypothetical protein